MCVWGTEVLGERESWMGESRMRKAVGKREWGQEKGRMGKGPWARAPEEGEPKSLPGRAEQGPPRVCVSVQVCLVAHPGPPAAFTVLSPALPR